MEGEAAKEETHHAMRQIAEIALPLGNDVQTVLPVDGVQYNSKGSNPPFALTEQTGGLKILDFIFTFYSPSCLCR